MLIPSVLSPCSVWLTFCIRQIFACILREEGVAPLEVFAPDLPEPRARRSGEELDGDDDAFPSRNTEPAADPHAEVPEEEEAGTTAEPVTRSAMDGEAGGSVSSRSGALPLSRLGRKKGPPPVVSGYISPPILRCLPSVCPSSCFSDFGLFCSCPFPPSL